MLPITREIIDGREPAIRWNAVAAGALVALGLWGVLQLIGFGVGVAALDPHDAEQRRNINIALGAWSVIVPLVAMFAGSYVAVRITRFREHPIASTHGLLVWAVTALVGLACAAWLAWGTSHGMRLRGGGMTYGRDVLRFATTSGLGLATFGSGLLLAIASARAGARSAARRLE